MRIGFPWPRPRTKKLVTVNTTNTFTRRWKITLAGCRIITFAGEKEEPSLTFPCITAFRPRPHSKDAFLSLVLSFSHISHHFILFLKGLICIRRVSGVGDAKSPAMPEIWLSPGPFFFLFQALQYYTAATAGVCVCVLYTRIYEEELARTRRKGGTIIVMASWAHWILIVFPEQKPACMYIIRNGRGMKKKKYLRGKVYPLVKFCHCQQTWK